MKMGFRLFAFGAALLLFAPPVPGQTPNRPEVVRLSFEGNESFTDRQLANSILTRETACRSFVLLPFCWADREFAKDRSFLNPRIFGDDYVRIFLFYRQRGYREVQIDTTIYRRTPTEVELTVTIDEGSPIRVGEIEFVGLEELEGRGVADNLPIRVGDPLNAIVLEAARDTLTQRLRNMGYAHVDVLRFQNIPTDSYDASVGFDVFTGPLARFGEIEVAGNVKVEDQVIQRMLPFRPGSLYSQELLFEAQRNLYNLEIFRHASIIQDLEHHPDSLVPLRVEVNEGDTHRVRSGGGWNTAECFNAESRWSSRNFMGGARRLVLRGRVSNLLTPTLEDSLCRGAGTDVYGELNWLVSADFTQPFIGSPRNSLSASIYAERQSLQDVFVRQAVGVNLAFTRRFGQFTPVTLSYRPQLASLDAAEVFFCTSFLVCDPLEIDLLQASNLLAPVGLSYSRDRTNRAISPTGGYTLLADVEHASRNTGSDFAYERAVGEATWFQALGPDMVLATRIRGGWLNARPFRGLRTEGGDERVVAHPQKRFYAGGANSVRGYAQNQLGPRVVTVGVEDLLFPRNDDPAPCTPEEVADLSCDASGLPDGRFFARPTGGGRLVEGNVELRFPVAGLLRGAAFADFGQVWSGGAAGRDNFVVTPGVGLRYSTPIGPIRVDLAYTPSTGPRLPVVTSLIRPFDPDRDAEADRIRGADGQVLDWVALQDLALLQPRIPFEVREGFSLRRLQLHFSIGQAF